MNAMDRPPFQVGDRVRVVRIPPHIDALSADAETKLAFVTALGNVYTVEKVDWGGWVMLSISDAEGIGVQPDCVELVDPIEKPSR
jgi:hypothetical protein